MSDTTRHGEPVFTVVKANTSQVMLATDDWVEAENLAYVALGKGTLLSVRGTHPSHIWDDQWTRRCVTCGGWDNGSYGSHAPCGYDFQGESLAAALKRELAARSTPAAVAGRDTTGGAQ